MAHRMLLRRMMSSGAAQKTGFIGLGNMGARMAENLVKAGHSVVVHDLNATQVSKLEKLGAASAASPAAVAAQATTIITMLPSSQHAHAVYCKDMGVFEKVQKGALLIDCSTIDPAMSKTIHAAAAALGVTFADAPVSGGTMGAENATLTFMVGSDPDSFERVKGALEPMGKKVVHCGGVSTGQIAKLCNNLILGITMAGVAEAFAMGKCLGIDPKKLADVVNSSSGRSWSSEINNPCPGVMQGVPSARDYEGGFACDLMVKDLGLANAAASGARTALPMGALAHQLYTLMSTQGMGTKDFSGIYTTLRRNKDKE
mmetsp:Transcript_10575/g.20889  ORF Transcript_10575/g.20889 Transcript_10575/m.20889 type:complete len:315 (+) Transcript_10575:104-1048(+)